MRDPFAFTQGTTMHANDDNKESRHNAGDPQRGTSEDRTAAAAATPRRVITGINLPPESLHPTESILSDCPTVGEHIASRPGHNNHAVLVHHPLPEAKAPPDAAIIDWFACTLRLNSDYDVDDIARDLRALFGILKITPSAKGWCGYQKRADLGGCGLLAWEGYAQRDTAHLSLNAHGCARVPDWQAVRAWGEAKKARIGRIDLAHDDFSGLVWNAERLRREYRDDLGFIGGDGRKPKSSLVGDWDNADKGRTYYVGSRAAGKMLRGYEKGKQLGEPDNPWFRLELELRGTNRVIPWDCLTQPGRYLAGAYPCLASLSSAPSGIETSVKAASMDYEKTLRHLNKQWGQFINLVVNVEQKDFAKALQILSRPGYPERFTPQLPALLQRNASTGQP